MTLQPWIAALLAAGVLLGWVRALSRRRRSPGAPRPRGWRTTALIVLQLLSAALLYRVLFPPPRAVPAGTLVVLTAGAADRDASARGAHVVRLPEAAAPAGAGAAVERVPDLATALRRYPGSTRVHVLGEGLVPRDRDAPGLPALDFDPPPLPRGITAIWAPARVQAGGGFEVHGQVHAVAGGAIDLIDPAGRRADTTALARDGGFALRALAAAAGPAVFRLRLRDAAGAVVERAPVAVVVGPPAPRRMRVLAGAPNPEVKFLRRWARDAGVELQTSVALGGGVATGDSLAWDAASLASLDLVVLDERALQALGAARFTALQAAVQDGLGVLVRVTGPLDSTARARLLALGHRLSAATLASDVRLDAVATGRPPSPRASTASQPQLPVLTRRALRIEAPDSATLLEDATGEPLARVRNAGRGRTASWLLSDTWRLVLAGHAARHAQLWSDALARIGRAAPLREPRLDHPARAGTRATLCALPAEARVVAPDGATARLHRDPRGSERCAAYWPAQPGWHVLEVGGRSWPFHVLAADALPALRAREVRDATRALAARPARAGDGSVATVGAPGVRWPWLLAWLVASGVLWWLERSRAGRR
ncbi:MAG TPA: carboxypeptidase regulatory-like domain-containing protein [Luteimonas sp.]|nr:carboxypeptidase regulatory-like domain-containing protein [Luteimonas sp.]